MGPQATTPRIHIILGILEEKPMCYLNQQVTLYSQKTTERREKVGTVEEEKEEEDAEATDKEEESEAVKEAKGGGAEREEKPESEKGKSKEEGSKEEAERGTLCTSADTI